MKNDIKSKIVSAGKREDDHKTQSLPKTKARRKTDSKLASELHAGDNQTSAYLFHQGTLYDAHAFLGCKLTDGGAFFRTAAPNASAVSVMGDFNRWNQSSHYLMRITGNGLYELFVDGIKEGDKYKFCIHTHDGRTLVKCDPYAVYSEDGGGRASIAYDINKFKWTDSAYLKKRAGKDIYNSPVNIYEAHIGSWKKHPDGRYYTYREFADSVVPYLADMSYTHLELIGIAEHPFDGSWGYQVTGYYAPTSRYGEPADFAYLINICHKHNIAVILDWVPGHFPKDDFGLYEFDGTPFYEAQGDKRQEHREWGTRCFDYGREEVQSFLVSNAVYWFDIFHIDGLRVDAVASMLYLDYNRKSGEWSPNTYGGRENLDAIAFLRKVNWVVFERFGGGIMKIAEESTAYPMVTKPVHDGGLGFNFKWNMGWMNDNLAYAEGDPFFRQYKHDKLTFSMTYAFSENYILPVSHDEVVHGKGSLINKMPGDYDLKFAGLRNFLMAMYSHPGKKLLMMGTEFGQFSEWAYKNELDWFLIGGYPAHKSQLDFVRTLNQLYKKKEAFWQNDCSWEGFDWRVADDNGNNVIAYIRKGSACGIVSSSKPPRNDVEAGSVVIAKSKAMKKSHGEDAVPEILCIYNFSPVPNKDYTVTLSEAGTYKTILSSRLYDWNTKVKIYETKVNHNTNHLTLDLPPMCGIWLERINKYDAK